MATRNVQRDQTVSHPKQLNSCRADVFTEAKAQVGKIVTSTISHKISTPVHKVVLTPLK